MLGWYGHEEAMKQLAEANRRWDAGERAEAVAMYRQLITQSRVPDKVQEPVVYLRVIEYDLDHGDAGSARKLADKALENGLDLRSDREGTAKLLVGAKADWEQRVAERARQKAEAEERAAKERSSRGSPGKGEVAYLDNGGSNVWVAIDEKAHDEMLSLSRAKNEGGIAQLMQAGRILVCGNRTKVTVVDPGIFTTTVRVMEGKHEGRTGILSSEFVRK